VFSLFAVAVAGQFFAVPYQNVCQKVTIFVSGAWLNGLPWLIKARLARLIIRV
jgi:hypothetical protein